MQWNRIPLVKNRIYFSTINRICSIRLKWLNFDVISHKSKTFMGALKIFSLYPFCVCSMHALNWKWLIEGNWGMSEALFVFNDGLISACTWFRIISYHFLEGIKLKQSGRVLTSENRPFNDKLSYWVYVIKTSVNCLLIFLSLLQ